MSELLIGMVGDVLVNRDDGSNPFRHVGPLLNAPDILFGNLECVYTDSPSPVPGTSRDASAPAHNLETIAGAGFNIMSLANNHVLDAGYDAMERTCARLNGLGIRTCGVGSTLADARAPAILERGGRTVAFLAYASVFPAGYEARSDMPGLAPMRAYDHWRSQHTRIHTPGMRPLATTIPDEADLRGISEDVAQARAKADIVIASFHWGDHSRPFHLTDHEKRLARYCIDLGVDVVVGHHHHALRGIQWYREKPIFYGLGHFVFDFPLRQDPAVYRARIAELAPGLEETPYSIGPREGWPNLPMHEDTRLTALAWVLCNESGISGAGVIPCALDPDGSVLPLEHGSARRVAVLDYLHKCNTTQGIADRLIDDGVLQIAGFPAVRLVPAGDPFQ